MTIENSGFLVLYSSNINATHDFWDKLSVPVKDHQIDKVVIDLGGVELHYVLDTTEPFQDYHFATKETGRGQGVVCYFEVKNIDTFYSLVCNHSKKITTVKMNHWNAREFLFSDPNNFLFVAYEMKR